MFYTFTRLLPAVLLIFIPAAVTLSIGAEQYADSSNLIARPVPGQSNDALLKKVRQVLDEYYLRPLNTRDDPPWSVLHWSIAYGVDAKIRVGHPAGKQVTAIGWLCSNYPLRGKQLIACSEDGLFLPIGPGVQGHDAQFLAMLAQSRVPANYLLQVSEQELTIADLVEHEKQTCTTGNEQTFKLIGIGHYEGTQARWQNKSHERWSVERLLQEELQQPISGRQATCGGLHRLFAFHYATELRMRETSSLSGPWQEAVQRTNYYQRRAFQLQNPDGSFSTAWLDKSEQRPDLERQLITSGHVLEWLAFSLPEDELRDPRFEKAVMYIVQLLNDNLHQRLHRGGMGHALHALAIYEQRMVCTEPGERSERLASVGVGPQTRGESID